MNYIRLPNNRIVENTAVVKEEERGFASELVQHNTTLLTDAVRKEIQKLSVLEVIA